jgi:uncharacterized protein
MGRGYRALGRGLARAWVGAALLLAAAALPAVAQCGPGRLVVQAGDVRHEFAVELADTDASRAQGLMGRAHLPSAAGMLFAYDAPQRAQFWMENTLIPLDMIFAAPDGVIKRVHANAVPLDRSVIDGGEGVQFVLEINGGLAQRIGIAPGARLHHPAIPGSDCGK